MGHLQSGPCGCTLSSYITISRYAFLAVKLIALLILWLVTGLAMRKAPAEATAVYGISMIIYPFAFLAMILPNVVGILAVKKRCTILTTLALIEVAGSFFASGILGIYAIITFAIPAQAYWILIFLIAPFITTAWYYYDFKVFYSFKCELEQGNKGSLGPI